MQRVSGPVEHRGMKTSLDIYIVTSTRDNGNDIPAHTLHLEFSDEKQITKLWPNEKLGPTI